MKHNIVLITADQLGAKWLGCYGSGVNSTPYLDSLAEEGVKFERCYATHPVCAPNRATLLTGRSSCIHGIRTNNLVLDTDMPTFAHVLQKNGYTTGGFGKFHQYPMHCPPPENISFLGFNESKITEDPKWPWYEWVRDKHPEHADTALAMAWAFWPCFPPHPDKQKSQKLKERIIQPLRKEAGWSSMYTSPLPPELHDTAVITDWGLEFIQKHEKDEKPFFCHISYVDPHDPYDPPEPYASMFPPEEMPDTLPAEWMKEGFEKLKKEQESFHSFSEIYDKPEIMKKLRSLYHGSLRYMDDQVKRVAEHLKNAGLWENTILLFTSDHGEMLGDHGLITKGQKHYDAGVRVPLIIAGGPVSGTDSDRLTCTLDFYPSFCDWAEAEQETVPPVEGLSFSGACTGSGGAENHQEIAVTFGDASSIFTPDGWRLTLYNEEQKGQMFNLKDDPDELNNLYNSPDHAEKRVELLQRLVRVVAQPNTLPQYRNMPVIDGKKIPVIADRMAEPLYRYTPEIPPGLTDSQ